MEGWQGKPGRAWVPADVIVQPGFVSRARACHSRCSMSGDRQWLAWHTIRMRKGS